MANRFRLACLICFGVLPELAQTPQSGTAEARRIVQAALTALGGEAR